MAKLTLEEIAILSGVSRSTVSRVINNHLEVRPEVRERVLKVVTETGFYPNPAARSLASRRSGIIGLVIPETTEIVFTDPYFAPLIQGVAEACNKDDYTLSLILFHVTEDEAKLPMRILGRQIFDGVIVTGTYRDDMLVPHLINQGIPFVSVGEYDDPKVNFVDTDNEGGAYAATRHLIQLGYKSIATITGPLNSLAAWHRQEGYLNALRDYGYLVDENLIATGNFTEASGYECMKTLLSLNPDAVFAASDMMAMGALRALRDAGLSVPADVALVGYDDLPPATLADPPLTTVHQPIKQTGIRAVRTLIDILENGLEPVRRVTLATDLVVRSSCGVTPNKKEVIAQKLDKGAIQ